MRIFRGTPTSGAMHQRKGFTDLLATFKAFLLTVHGPDLLCVCRTYGEALPDLFLWRFNRRSRVHPGLEIVDAVGFFTSALSEGTSRAFPVAPPTGQYIRLRWVRIRAPAGRILQKDVLVAIALTKAMALGRTIIIKVTELAVFIVRWAAVAGLSGALILFRKVAGCSLFFRW